MCAVSTCYGAIVRIRSVETVWSFFFQAEDGIRDAQESRGLGDVYKRQAQKSPTGDVNVDQPESPPEPTWTTFAGSLYGIPPVSYTHLTLPTIYSV